MAIRSIAAIRTGAIRPTVGVPTVGLALTLVAPAIDLFARLQPSPFLATAALYAAALTALMLLPIWLRAPRAMWLFAATAAALASVAVRLVIPEVGSALSLLAIVALGVGGAFRSADLSLESTR